MRKGNLSTDEIYAGALRKWGFDHQVSVACEEFSELQVSLLQYHVRNKIPLANVVDELADARIMIEQMEKFFCVEESVKYRRDEKLDRLEQLITK